MENNTWKSFKQARIARQLAWSLQALGLGLTWSLSALLPPDRASSAGRHIMQWLGPRLGRTETIRRNLRIAFPEKDEAQIALLTREIWGNIGSVLLEYPHLGAIRENRDGRRVEVVVKGKIQALERNAGPVIFVSAHIGNWELGPGVVVGMGVSLNVIHTEQQNPLILAMLQGKRRATGSVYVPKEAGLRPILRLLDKGEAIALLPDQKIKTGELVPFFGRDAATTDSPARLALRFGCELVPARVERLKDAQFRVTLYEPVRPDDDQADPQTQALQMTRRLNALIEGWIRERPGEWWCPKNRWPKVEAAESPGPEAGQGGP